MRFWASFPPLAHGISRLFIQKRAGFIQRVAFGLRLFRDKFTFVTEFNNNKPLTIKTINMMNKHSFTLLNVRNCALRTVRRFPVTMALAVVYVVVFLIQIWHPSLSSTALEYLTKTLRQATMLSFALTLWNEVEGTSHLRESLLAYAGLLAIGLYWAFFPASTNIVDTAFAAVDVLLLTLCIYLPFLKEPDDVASTNFLGRFVLKSIVAFFPSLLVTVTFSLLVGLSFPILFDLEASLEDYFTIFLFSQVLLCLLIFLSRIPQRWHLVNHRLEVSSWANAALRAFLIPVTAVYMLILYFYTFHILLAWELPNGGVSYLVAVLMGMVLLVEVFLYFVNRSGYSYSVDWFLRWLPMLAMPLLVLMSIGIYRRISDYGLTAMRLYLVTLNVWFYAVCIIMFVTRVRRIHWIPLSFAAIFALTSVLPINYHTIARDFITRDLQQRLAGTNVGKVKSVDDLMRAVDSIPQKDVSEIKSRIYYLHDNYGDETLQMWVNKKN